MRRLEIIHLRWTSPRPGDALAAVRGAVAGLGAAGRVTVYRHAAVPTDVGIHIRHDGGRADPELTALGQRLAAALRELGMVEHSTWIEPES